jgi:hypothetical protein
MISTMSKLLMVILFASLPAFAQRQSKLIEWPKVSVYNSKTRTTTDNHIVDRIDEIEIQAILVEGQTIIIGERFSATDDWLKNISFRVKNVSGKQIKQIQITLVLPEIFRSPQIQYVFRSEKPSFIESGTEVQLTMPGGGLYPWVKSRIEEEQSTLARVNRAQILVSYVTMADETLLSSDCVKTSDLRNACPYRTP